MITNITKNPLNLKFELKLNLNKIAQCSQLNFWQKPSVYLRKIKSLLLINNKISYFYYLQLGVRHYHLLSMYRSVVFVVSCVTILKRLKKQNNTSFSGRWRSFGLNSSQAEFGNYVDSIGEYTNVVFLLEQVWCWRHNGKDSFGII